ncbi:MAG: type 1 glutamine amidotransferase [Thermodesulfobacteriota bacterium]
MRLHLLEHEPAETGPDNVTTWARSRGHELEQTDVHAGAGLPCPDDFDWLVVLGGSMHAWEEDKFPWLAREKCFIARTVEAGRIVLGLCFGAQLLAQVLGGRVFPNSEPEIGWHEVELTEAGRESFLFQGLPDRFTTFHWHGDHFSLPEGALTLASSPATPHQAFILPDRPMVGVQFHPEYTRAMIAYYARVHGREWTPARYVTGGEETIARTATLPDTFRLMASLLDNLVRRFGPG